MRKPEVVVITGASAGVGRAIAHRFAAPGRRLALLARGHEGLEGARRDVEERNGEALAIAVDVADSAQVEAAAETVESTFGPIDVWINCAMVTVLSEFKDMEPDEFRRTTEVTYLGYVWGTMTALRRMLPRNRGVVVQVGSALAYRAIPLQSAYCGAKHAVRGFTDSLRCELRHNRSRVHLTMVQLSAFNTPQFTWARNKLNRRPQPLPPIFQPEVAADAVYWAARHRRREVWVGGPSVKTILGNRLAPGLLDRYLARKGYSGQLTGEPETPGRPDNLFQPVEGDYGAHGRFDSRARKRSWQLKATTHRRAAVSAALLIAAGSAAWALARRRGNTTGLPRR